MVPTIPCLSNHGRDSQKSHHHNGGQKFTYDLNEYPNLRVETISFNKMSVSPGLVLLVGISAEQSRVFLFLVVLMRVLWNRVFCF